MKKILCIGDLALDVISQLKEPINYGNDTASKISSHPGGQAANVATWITRTNSKAHLVARTGNDPVGFALISDLDKYGVEHLNLMHSGRPTGVVVILVDANGEIILTALLKSKSLSTKDIKAVLDASLLSTSEKKLLSTYAQTLNNLKSTQSLRNFKIPLSQSLSEDFTSSTPKTCTIVDGLVKTLKSGACVLSIKFTTESGFEVQTTKKITLKK
jgi:bifunctional ADP-heptose synthase (sugar kinase/adenylyltransferase)